MAGNIARNHKGETLTVADIATGGYVPDSTLLLCYVRSGDNTVTVINA